MCGIAGVVDLAGQRPIPRELVRAMADALFHRGPDEDGFLERPGLALASRRLSIVGLKDGRQPIANEDGTVSVVFNGELFEHAELRERLEANGHRCRTHCDTEVIPHLWEDHGEGMFAHLRGQFAIALWDDKERLLILGRDRFGICPLYWTRRTTAGGDWLLFASEIKALLASGLVEARPDRHGIDHAFTFFALPGPVTCFEGIRSLVPGHYLSLRLGAPGSSRPAHISERIYWEMDFPDHGEEEVGRDPKRLIDDFEAVLCGAVERRLRADVPVVSYLSGGVDSGLVTTLAAHLRGRPTPTFTIRIPNPALDETDRASLVARCIGADPVVVECGDADVLATYPALVRAAEGPVIDTSCAALLLLAREVHRRGYKVALSGEGADEWLAGYSWFKLHRVLSFLDVIPGVALSTPARRAFLWLTGAPEFPWSAVRRIERECAGKNAWHEIYGLMGLARPRFYSPEMRAFLAGSTPYADLGLNRERMRRWHPFNRSLYLGARVHLPGLLLSAKGDRVAMQSAVETRYPFLDEAVFNFLAPIHPRWKLHGFRDKYLLRRLADRWLPAEVARRPKAMFRAPLDGFHLADPPAWVDQLVSAESLRKTGYFNPQAVAFWREAYRSLRAGSHTRVGVEMGLVAVVATQLWHHTFIEGGLADLPGRVPTGRAMTVPA